MRACSLGIENGVEVVAPIHDAILICAPLDRLDADIERMRGFMEEASRIVLGGPTIDTETAVIARYPQRYAKQYREERQEERRRTLLG